MRSESFTLVGHRGAMGHAPENSIASFRLAEQMGVDEIELDVRLTADGVAIVLHDATLDRTAADGSGRGLGPVAELNFDQIKDIELDSGRGVLTFEEALDNTTVTLQVEIKAIEVVPELGRIAQARPDDAQRIQFTSFSADALHAVAEVAPFVPRGLIVAAYPDADNHPAGIRSVLASTGSGAFYCGWNGLTADLVRELHEAGLQVHAWPLKTSDDAVRALELGVDGTTTDFPADAKQWLACAHTAGGQPQRDWPPSRGIVAPVR
ncbi:glycerophosphodiester phosphodiesterase family protein [Rhodococcus sp. IEGM 1379]|uniref:glycerophosphodiester phosphodiesterase n=1 Tax=Rhodococcus sp. IEGM 1379 TaxID=3047086 RepID=UPI0024B79B54|nr:glycerophosphodiester phosphodiesterase family protein [Rhodococcus sp. IEGM 1379]MDI9916774.1 glycerophosphodiester phosphodiesterase family protein [Rhodococcus sp. IEGM 1379]